MPTPWNHDTELMHVAIKGYDIAPATTPHANLVFLIDVSGSMDEPDKLPLLKSAFRLLVNRLKPDDTVSIVTYAGNAGTVLAPTRVAEKSKILSAIDRLEPGGSTGGAEGIEAAYDLAKQGFVKDGVNRVMLATDGDFNVGPSSDEDLKRIIEERRKDGIFLTVLGFGRGNLNDSLMQTLAQNGNGSAAYIDTLAEAQKTLVEEAGSTLFPIASDVKFQVEFNPERIAEYRLIGYETRALNREDFNNDRVDAGDIGSGHSVTAIYEITPKGSPAVMNDDLRYGAADKAPAAAADSAHHGELAFVKMRYKKAGRGQERAHHHACRRQQRGRHPRRRAAGCPFLGGRRSLRPETEPRRGRRHLFLSGDRRSRRGIARHGHLRLQVGFPRPRPAGGRPQSTMRQEAQNRAQQRPSQKGGLC